MDIGPISAIRPVILVKPSPVAPDLSRVFEVEYLGQSRDDEYSPANRRAARGLENEDDAVELEPGDDTRVTEPAPAGSLSLFA